MGQNQITAGFETFGCAGLQRKTRGVLMRALVGCGLLASALVGSETAYAVEGGVYGAPLGGTDVRQAYLPPTPGFYGGFAGVAALSPNYRDQNGNVSATASPAYLYAAVMGAGILYVYPYNPLGFTVASSFQLNYINEQQALTINGVHKSGHGSGFQDSFSDLFYASHYIGLFGAVAGDNPKLHYGLTGAFGLAAEIPLGAYNVNNFVNPGKNTFITIPNVALTYLTGPNLSFFDGTEISTRFFFDTNKRNSISGYQGGNLIDLDYAITERAGAFQFGVAGDYAQQLNGDHSATYALVAPGGAIYSKIDLGPVFVYDSPDLGATFKAKALFPIYHTNNYNATTVVFSVSRKLF
jgi:hypothetical protein